MAEMTCPKCAAEIAVPADRCTNCGALLPRNEEEPAVAPIRKLKGKVLVAGTVLLAAGVVATVLGAWWGPALLFPAVVIFFLGRMW
jgi:hypothetical protein